jgi:hypothetical protein
MVSTAHDDERIRLLTDAQRPGQAHEIDQVARDVIAIGIPNRQIFQALPLQELLGAQPHRGPFASNVGAPNEVERLPMMLPTGNLQRLDNRITPGLAIDHQHCMLPG